MLSCDSSGPQKTLFMINHGVVDFPILYFVVLFHQYACLFLSLYLLTFNTLFIRYSLTSSLETGHSSLDVKHLSVLPLGIGTVILCALGIIILTTEVALKP